MKFAKRQLKQQRRAVSLVWVVITLFVLIGFVGLALDAGFVLFARHQLQNTSDAAALAGAQKVRDGAMETRQAAIDVGLANTTAKTPVQLDPNNANAGGGDIVIGRYDRTEGVFSPTIDSPNAVKVRARRTETSLGGPLPIQFGPAFGVNDVDVSTSAVAMIGGGTGAGLITLCDGNCTLRVSGNVELTVNDGAIQVNSDDDCGVCGNGTSIIDTPDLNVGGDPGTCTTPGVDITGDVHPNSPPIPDPLETLPPPAWNPASDGGPVSITGGDNVTLSAGYYSGGISASGGTCNCDPGIFVLGGVGLDIKGDTTFIAEGVMFYVMGSGVVDLAGTGNILITPPDPDQYSYADVGTYEGVSIFQARAPGGTFNENGDCGDSRIIGTSLLDLRGTLYFSCAFLEVGGTGDGFGNQLITCTMWVHGTGDIEINYNGNFPAPGFDVFLVE